MSWPHTRCCNTLVWLHTLYNLLVWSCTKIPYLFRSFVSFVQRTHAHTRSIRFQSPPPRHKRSCSTRLPAYGPAPLMGSVYRHCKLLTEQSTRVLNHWNYYIYVAFIDGIERLNVLSGYFTRTSYYYYYYFYKIIQRRKRRIDGALKKWNKQMEME